MLYVQNATTFLIGALFSFALYTVLLRFWMQWVRADFRNDVGQFIITVTNPVIIPLRRILPSIGAIDTATIVFALLISTLKFCCLFFILGNLGQVSILKLISFGVAGLIESCIYILIATIFINFIASWINPHSYHPILSIARSISEPLMLPVRKLIPSISGIDFSPMVVLLFLQFTLKLFVAPLYNLPI